MREDFPLHERRFWHWLDWLAGKPQRDQALKDSHASLDEFIKKAAVKKAKE